MRLNELILTLGFSMTAIGSVISLGMIVTQKAATVISSKPFYLSGTAIVLGIVVICFGFLMETDETHDSIKKDP